MPSWIASTRNSSQYVPVVPSSASKLKSVTGVDESQVVGMVMSGVGDGFDVGVDDGGDGLGSEDVGVGEGGDGLGSEDPDERSAHPHPQKGGLLASRGRTTARNVLLSKPPSSCPT